MGRAAVITEEAVGYICGTGSLFIRPDFKRFVADLLCLVLRSPQSVATLKEHAVGTTMTNLNQRALGVVDLPAPELDEQREVIRRVEAFAALADVIERRVAAATARADKLTQAVPRQSVQG